MAVSNNPVQARSSVPPETLAGIQEASKNEKDKELLAIQKLQIANTAAMGKADREARSADLKFSTEEAAAQNQLSLAQDTKKWKDKNASDAAMQERNLAYEKQSQINEMKFQKIMNGIGSSSSNEILSAGATADSDNLGITFNSSNPDHNENLKLAIDAKGTSLRKQAKIIANRTEQELIAKRQYMGGGVDSEGNVYGPSGNITNAYLQLATQINQRYTDNQSTTTGTSDAITNIINRTLGDFASNMSITGTIDLDTATNPNAKPGQYFQQMASQITGVPFSGDIQLPGGVIPSEVPYYDKLWGKKGILAGPEGPLRMDDVNPRDIDLIRNMIEESQIAGKDAINEIFHQEGYKLPEELRGQLYNKLIAYEETMLFSQGVSKEEYYKAAATQLKIKAGEEVSFEDQRDAEMIHTLTEGSGQNPLANLDWVNTDRLTPYDADLSGDKFEMSQQGTSGNVSSLRLVHQIAPELDNLMPGLGNDFKTAIYAMTEFNNTKHTDKDMAKLRGVLNPIMEKNGGLNALVLDNVFDSFGTKYDFATPQEEGEEFSSMDRQFLEQSGLGEDALRSDMYKAHAKSQTNLKKEMQGWSGTFNMAYTGTNASKIDLDKAVSNELLGKITQNVPVHQTSTDANGEPIMTPQLPEKLIDQVFKMYTSGIYASQPEKVQEKLISGLLDELSYSALEGYTKKYQEATGKMTDYGQELSDLQFDLSDTFDELQKSNLDISLKQRQNRDAELDALITSLEAQ